MEKTPISKKVACDMLNIAYNTARLQRIIDDYQDKVEYRTLRKKNRIEDEQRQMQRFVKQLNDTFPEIPSQKSRVDSSEVLDSLDPSLTKWESLHRYRKRVESICFLIRALRIRSRPEKLFGPRSTTNQQESITNSQSTTKQSEQDS